jgi:hypothetical protein
MSQARILTRVLPLFGLCLTTLAPAHADEVYTFVVKKQEEKKKVRWSLAEWLDTRDRMRMQDLWLALHSPSPYEFFFGADYRLSDQGEGGARYDKSLRLSAAAYATIFGLEAQRRFSPLEEWLGMFDLRVFGYHQQSTNITLNAGLRVRDLAEGRSRNAVLGGAMTVYVNRFCGVDGSYRHQFANTPDGTGTTRSGNSLEAGLFMDFNFVRVYGHYFNDSEDITGALTGSGSHSGGHLGTRFYF